MTVILNEVKDLTGGMRVYWKQLKINEAMMIQGSLKMMPALARSLDSLGMTE